MKIDDRILKCIAFLGMPTEKAGFAIEGTAFCVVAAKEGLDLYFLITAKHVVNALPDKFYIRANRDQDIPVEIPSSKEKWIAHPDKNVDLCVCKIEEHEWNNQYKVDLSPIQMNTFFLSKREKDLPPHIKELWLGDEVFVIGAFLPREGEKKNIPIARVGHIASKPEEPMWGSSPTKPAFLIEVRSLGGLSGSPVFVNIFRYVSPDRCVEVDLGTEKSIMRFPYALIGINIGAHFGNYKSDFAPSEKSPATDSDFNTGISVVLPDILIAETIEIIMSL